jgi:hypothetical protein
MPPTLRHVMALIISTMSWYAAWQAVCRNCGLQVVHAFLQVLWLLVPLQTPELRRTHGDH